MPIDKFKHFFVKPEGYKPTYISVKELSKNQYICLFTDEIYKRI